MKVNLGTVIQLKRKEKKLTQQQLADFVGVSKAAVSKWESSQTYPDIRLLPILAAYFHCTIDELLSYEPELSVQEIQRICFSLKQSLQTEDSQTTWATIEELIKKYYSCEAFLLQVGILILNHSDRLPKQTTSPQIDYIEYAKRLFQQVQQHPHDIHLVIEAKTLEAYCDLAIGDYDAVLTLLGNTITPILPTDHLIVSAFQHKQELESAVEVAQCSIYQQIMMCLQTGVSYINVAQTSEIVAQTLDRFIQMIDIFDIERLNPALVLNVYLSGLMRQVAFHDTTAIKQSLLRLDHLLSAEGLRFDFSRDDYFDRVTDWLTVQALGNQTLRAQDLAIRDLQQVLHSEQFSLYDTLLEMKQIRATLTNLMEEGQ